MIHIQGKHILIMGLGLNDGGLGAVKYALRSGAKSLLITDLRSQEALAQTMAKIEDFARPYSTSILYRLGEHQEEDFLHADMIIRNHGVPLTSPYIILAQSKQIPVVTDIEMFFEEIYAMDNLPMTIGITGTRGKSTTTMLIAHILQSAFGKEKVFIGGNIGKSVLDILPLIQQDDYIVLELSSFQLEVLKKSPHIAVFTSFFPDHLNRHSTLDEYFEAKTHIAKYQTANDYFVGNIDNQRILDFVKTLPSQSKTYSLTNTEATLYRENNALILDGNPIIHTDDIAIPGEHNQYNSMAAILVARTLNIDNETIRDSIKSFKGVEGRQESLGLVRGIEIINDTTSTMPVALCTALDAFRDKPIHLICGGENKNLSYEEIAQHLNSSLQSVILIPGQASQEMKQYFGNIPVHEVSHLDEAVAKALSLAQSGERIVFSPGATSFGAYLNEFDRGNHFVKIIDSYR